jgi:hypothetical protein
MVNLKGPSIHVEPHSQVNSSGTPLRCHAQAHRMPAARRVCNNTSCTTSSRVAQHATVSSGRRVWVHRNNPFLILLTLQVECALTMVWISTKFTREVRVHLVELIFAMAQPSFRLRTWRSARIERLGCVRCPVKRRTKNAKTPTTSCHGR